LSQLAKILGPSYYYLYSLFNKIRDKGKIVSASSEGVGERGRERGWGKKGGVGGKGEEMTQTLYAHMNKRKNKRHIAHRFFERCLKVKANSYNSTLLLQT
jgi:hypothetical protein